jgi:CheY-like chemotaxis protein
MKGAISLPIQIFLAEDNPADVYLIKQALKEYGVECNARVASDGKEALTQLRREGIYASMIRPDLILLDLNLPQHDGMEILQYIREDPWLASIPVVILTSSDSPRDRLRADQLGANRYIRKPSTLGEFLAIGAVFRDMLYSNATSEVSGSA